MAAAYSAVVAKLGTPLRSREYKGCSNAYQELRFLDLSCSVGYKFEYGTSSLSENKKLAAEVLSIMKTQHQFNIWDFGWENGSLQDGGTFRALYKDRGELSCGLTHDVKSRQNLELISGVDSTYIGDASYVSNFDLACENIVPKPVYRMYN